MGQNKKIVQRDSMWVSMTCDTIFGKIQYNVGQGIVKGDGIVVHCIQRENHKRVPPIPIDTLRTGSYWLSTGEMSLGWPEPAYAMIKTTKGYVRISEKYIFIPD